MNCIYFNMKTQTLKNILLTLLYVSYGGSLLLITSSPHGQKDIRSVPFLAPASHPPHSKECFCLGPPATSMSQAQWAPLWAGQQLSTQSGVPSHLKHFLFLVSRTPCFLITHCLTAPLLSSSLTHPPQTDSQL